MSVALKLGAGDRTHVFWSKFCEHNLIKMEKLAKAFENDSAEN
ncbi:MULTISPECIES: hypothetical protein [unclassified Microcoleus]